MIQKLTEILKLIRINHWIKNILVFIPLLFSKNLFNQSHLISILFLFFSFSLFSSLVYVLNDLVDIQKDKNHPTKKYRPIASETVSKKNALILILVLFVLCTSSLAFLNQLTSFILITYLLMNVAYTFVLKNVVILDILIISIGFMLRVLSGGTEIEVEISSWLVLATIFVSLYLAILKRKSEIDFVKENNTRDVLTDYSSNFINQIVTITSGGIIICYALYTLSERTLKVYGTENLVYTVLFVIFGVLRYNYLSDKKLLSENVLENLFTDKYLLVNMVLYLGFVFAVIYN